MADQLILSKLKSNLGPLIFKNLSINLTIFEKSKDILFKINNYPFTITNFETKEKRLIYKYFCYGCSLIQKEINKENINKVPISYIPYFDQTTDEYKLIISINISSNSPFEPSKILISSIPKIKYGIPINIKCITIPRTMENKTITRLINENLNMTNHEFNHTMLEHLPIKHSLFKDYYEKKLYNFKLEDKLFVVGCFFIESYLKKIQDFKKYYASFDKDLLVDFKNNSVIEDIKNYKIFGKKKMIACNLINAPDDFLAKIPDELLDIKIFKSNLHNLEEKIDFKEGTFLFGSDIINIKKIKHVNPNYNFIRYLFKNTSKHLKELEVTFNNKKEHNEKYEIIENDDTIICKITKLYKFKGFDVDTSNKKKIILKNAFHTYNTIIFQKIHNIE
jgi:hypothetical protein